jgi:4-amino-4-deoxy-L-arabinose transferase-like glycosyltransferase
LLLQANPRAMRAVRPRLALVVALAVALGALVRLLGLGSQSLWMDEGFTSMMARVPLHDLPSAGLGIEKHPPLYYLLAKLSTACLGESELALRLPAALAGTLTLVVAGAVALQCGGSAAAVAATLLLAVSSLHTMMSRDARGYGVATLLLLVATRSWLQLLGSPSQGLHRRTWLGYVLACIAACYTHYLCAVVVGWQWLLGLPSLLPPQADTLPTKAPPEHAPQPDADTLDAPPAGVSTADISTAPPGEASARATVSAQAQRSLRALWLATPLVLGLAALPWAAVVRAQAATPSPGHAPACWADLGDIVWAQAVGFTLNLRNYVSWGPLQGGWLQIDAVVAATLGLMLLGGRPPSRTEAGEHESAQRQALATRRLVGLFGAFGTTLVALSKLTGAGLFETRYTVLVAPLFWIAVAAGLERLRREGWRLASLALLAALASLNLCSTYNFVALEEWQRQDMRGLAEVLRTRTHAGDLVLLEGDWAVPALRFYLPQAPAGVTIVALNGPSARGLNPRTLPAQQRVWLACASASLVDPYGHLGQALGQVRQPGWRWEALRRNPSFNVSATLFAPPASASAQAPAPAQAPPTPAPPATALPGGGR